MASREFVRNVWANIVANLIAAALIYLGAVSFGYIRAQPIVLGIALILVIAFAMPAAVVALVQWIRGAIENSYTMSVAARKAFLVLIATVLLALVLFIALGPIGAVAIFFFTLSGAGFVGLALNKLLTRFAPNSSALGLAMLAYIAIAVACAIGFPVLYIVHPLAIG